MRAERAKKTMPSAWARAIAAALGPDGLQVGESTAQSYRYRLTKLAEGLGTQSPADVTLEDLEGYFVRAGERWAPSALDQSRKVARIFFRWAEEAGEVDASPFRDVAVVTADDLRHPNWRVGCEAMADELTRRGRSESTIAGYAKHVGWLADAVEGVDPWEEVASSDVTAWLHRASAFWSADTRRKVLVSLRAFYAEGVRNGWCQRSPLVGVAAMPGRKRGPEQISAPPAWQAPISEFLAWMVAGNRADGTIDQRRWWLTRLAENFADPWAVTTQDLVAFLSREDWAGETKRGARSSVINFYWWAELEQHIDRSPARLLPRLTVHRGLPRPIPDGPVEEALSIADDRTKLAIEILRYTGVRRAELAGIHTRDILEREIIIHGKGGRDRLVPVNDELARLLRQELRRRREGREIGTGWGTSVPPADGWLFPSDRPGKHLTPAHLGKLVARVLPDHWTAHSLRHRAGSVGYAATRDLRSVQEMLGHAKPETSAIYTRVPDGGMRAIADAL